MVRILFTKSMCYDMTDRFVNIFIAKSIEPLSRCFHKLVSPFKSRVSEAAFPLVVHHFVKYVPVVTLCSVD